MRQRTMRDMPSNDPASGLHVTVETYSCPPGRGLEKVIIEGGGLTWPGAHQSAVVTMVLGPVTSDIDGNEMMWSFFQSQTAKY